MKTILCFGDSNTFGFNPSNGSRYSSDVRWASLFKSSVCSQFDVIEAGCNNRTCFSDNPVGIEQTGYRILSKYLTSDINYLVLQLGINDLQTVYNNDLTSFEKGLTSFVQLALSINPDLNIVFLSPSKIDNCVLNSYFSTMFDEKSIEYSKDLYNIYKRIAGIYSCEVINLDNIVETSNIDGIHYSEDAHKTIANVLNDYFLNLT